MSAGECQTKNVNDYDEEVSIHNSIDMKKLISIVIMCSYLAFNLSNLSKDDKDVAPPLDEGDIALLKTYGLGPYATAIKNAEEEIKKHQQTVKDLIGIKESDTGLSPPSQWDFEGTFCRVCESGQNAKLETMIIRCKSQYM